MSHEELEKEFFEKICLIVKNKENAPALIREIEDSPVKSWVKANLIGQSHFAVSCYEEAIDDFWRALDGAPQDKWYTIYEFIGHCYVELGEYDVGLKFCNSAIDLSPSKDDLLGLNYNFGWAFFRAHKYKEAILFITKTLNCSPPEDALLRF